jgi:hypothetical protein
LKRDSDEIAVRYPFRFQHAGPAIGARIEFAIAYCGVTPDKRSASGCTAGMVRKYGAKRDVTAGHE